MKKAIRISSKKRIREKFWEQRFLMILVLPAVLWMLIFSYIPMYGVAMAFKEYDPFMGFIKSPWVGLANFKEVFSDPIFYQVLKNNIIQNAAKLIIGFPLPIIFAILLNELTSSKIKKITQTMSYLPYFISWVFVVGFMQTMLAPGSGAIFNVLEKFGLVQANTLIMGDSHYFLSMVVISDIWKNLGWSSILFIAAITAIDTQQYEAAYVDGANRFARIWHITLPGIKPTIAIVLILNISWMLSQGNGFDQIFLLSNPIVQDVADTVGIYSYRLGVVLGRFSFATAVGVFQSVVSVILLVLANGVTRKVSEESLF